MVSAKPELGNLLSGAVGGLLGILGVDINKLELYSEPTWGFGLQEVFTIDNLPHPFKEPKRLPALEQNGVLNC